MEIKIPVSPGELLDKLSILQLKATRITDPVKVANVAAELDVLKAAWTQAYELQTAMADAVADAKALNHLSRFVFQRQQDLAEVNGKLWDVEDRLREKEALRSFDVEFTNLARSVYYLNDQRSALKRSINQFLGSSIMEEKQLPSYDEPKEENDG